MDFREYHAVIGDCDKMTRVIEILCRWRPCRSVMRHPSQSGGVKSVPVISARRARGLYFSTGARPDIGSASLVFDWAVSGGAVSL